MSFAQVAFADALDHLLDPLENLRKESFRCEPVQVTETKATAGRARLRLPSGLWPVWWLSVFAARLRYGTRAPYRHVRAAVFWCGLAVGLIAIGALIGWLA
jgi:hypothetical protein